MSMLEDMLARFAGNPSAGGDMASQAMQSAMGMLIDPNSTTGQSINQMIENQIAPSLREQFGIGPLEMRGGLNAVWNPVTAMNQVARQKMSRTVFRDTGAQISAINQQMFEESMRARGLDPSKASSLDMNRMAIGLGSMLSGSRNINMALQQNMGAMGYQFGMPGDRAQGALNDRIYKNLFGAGGLGTQLTEAYVRDQGSFGNIGGKGMGDILQGLASKGMLDVGGADSAKLGQLKDEIQKTSRAISGIRDIIKGPVSEVIKQLEATFGAESISAYGSGGLRVAAGKMENLRQLADMSGMTTGQMAQFSRASGIVSQQIAGHSVGTMAAGLTIGAFVGAKPGEEMMKGLDPSAFANTMAQRVTGAQQSAVGLMVSAALAKAKDSGMSAEGMDTLRSQLVGEASKGNLTATRISEIATGAGAKMSAQDVEQGRYTRRARDYSNEDSTGTYAALGQSKARIDQTKAGVLQSLGLPASLAGKSLREIEAEIGKNGTDAQKAALGPLNLVFNEVAKGFGYTSDEELSNMTARYDKARGMEATSKARTALAQDFATMSGGIGQLIKDIGAGKDVKGSLQNMLGTMSGEKQKEFLSKAMGKENADFMGKFLGGGNKTWADEAMDLKNDPFGLKKSESKDGPRVPMSAREAALREKALQDTIVNYSLGQNSKGERIEQGTFNFQKEVVSAYDALRAGNKNVMEEAAIKASGGTQDKYSRLKFEEKQAAAVDILQQKLGKDAPAKGDKQSTADYLNVLRDKARERDKKDDTFVTGDVEKIVKNGVEKDMTEYISEALKWLERIFNKP